MNRGLRYRRFFERASSDFGNTGSDEAPSGATLTSAGVNPIRAQSSP